MKNEETNQGEEDAAPTNNLLFESICTETRFVNLKHYNQIYIIRL